MKIKQPLGIHVRIQESITQALTDVAPLNCTALQFFLFKQKEHKHLRITQDDIQAVHKLKSSGVKLFAHSSYWINIAHGNKKNFSLTKQLLTKELKIAQRLSLNGLVIHPGAYTGHDRSFDDETARQESLEQIARVLNSLFKKKTIPIIFENTAHKKKSIGSDFQDFYDLKQLLDKPEQLLFCIDFAHAHAFGYDLTKTKTFLNMLKKMISLESIALLHLHDSAEPFDSGHDRHTFIGDGTIGTPLLKKIIQLPELSQIPIILELPTTSEEKNKAMLDLVRSWKK